eukprot:403367986
MKRTLDQQLTGSKEYDDEEMDLKYKNVQGLQMKQQTQRIDNNKNKFKNSFEDLNKIEKYLEQDSEVRIDWDDQENYDSEIHSKIQTYDVAKINQSQFGSNSSRFIDNQDLESSGMPFQSIGKKNHLKKRAKNKQADDDQKSQLSQKLTKQKVMQLLKQEMIRLYNDPFNNEDAVIQDSYVTFKFQRFAKYFVYHFLFFFLTGPITGLLLLPFENWTYLYNMGFLGLKNGSYYFQVVHYVFQMTCIVLYFQFNQEGFMDPVQLYMLVLVTLMRCLIVSIRYGTTTDSRVETQYQKIFTRKDNESEFLGSGWRDILPEQIDQEIKHSMIRNEVENSFFNIRFLYKIAKFYKDRIQLYDFYKTYKYDIKNERKYTLHAVSLIHQQDLKKTLRGNSKTNVIKTQPSSKNSSLDAMTIQEHTYIQEPNREDAYTYFSGRLIFKELQLVSKTMAHRMQSWILVLISFVHAVLPLVINMFNDSKSSDIPLLQQPKYRSAQFWGYFISCFCVNMLIYMVNLTFIEIGLIDMKRRKYQMKILEIMLEPNRFKVLPKHRIFPLINYFDPQSLLSWMDIRIMALDIGRRFYIRIEMYAFSYLFVYGVLGAIYLCWYFELLMQEFSQSLIIVGAFEILNFLYFLYLMFQTGAQINELSTKQILRITELRGVIERLETGCDKILQKNHKFANMFVNRTFKDAILYFGYVQEDFGDQKVRSIIDKTTSVLAIIQDRLEKEKEYNPIKIMGIPLNTTILYAIQSSLLTLIAAMINKKTGLLSS